VDAADLVGQVFLVVVAPVSRFRYGDIARVPVDPGFCTAEEAPAALQGSIFGGDVNS
jgi:hypothetical protein